MIVVESIGSGSSVCGAIPRVLFARCYVVGCIIVLVNSEVQSISAGTSFVVCIVIQVYAGFAVSLPVPSETIAGLLSDRIMGAVVDGEVQRVYICASGVGLRVVESIGAGDCICCAIPRVLFASCNVVGSVIMLVNSEV